MSKLLILQPLMINLAKLQIDHELLDIRSDIKISDYNIKLYK